MKGLKLLLCVALLFASISGASSMYLDYQPRLIVDNRDTPVLFAGTESVITFLITNHSNHVARNIIVTPQFDPNTTPFVLDQIKDYIEFREIAGSQAVKVDFRYIVKEDAESKYYPITILIEYDNLNGVSFEKKETIFVKVENRLEPPNVGIIALGTDPKVIIPGSISKLDIVLKNLGDINALDFEFSLEGLESGKLELHNSAKKHFHKQIKPQELKYISYNLYAHPDIVEGIHNLRADISYKTAWGREYKQSFTISVNVASNVAGVSNVEITSNRTSYEVNNYKELAIELVVSNKGNEAIENIKVSIKDRGPFVPNSTSIFFKDKVDSGQIYNIAFSLRANAEEQGTYPVIFLVEYDEVIGTRRTKRQIEYFVPIYVSKSEGSSDEGFKPRVIVDNYTLDPTVARAGEEFDLEISFLNTNRELAVGNIKVSLMTLEGSSESNSAFTPVGSSNTFFIDMLNPNRSATRNIRFYTAPDAKAKTYTIQATIEYEDTKGNTYKEIENIGIPVTQPSRLEIGDYFIPVEAFVGDMISVNFEFYNMGRITLSNLRVRVEGNFMVNNGSNFVGNLNAGAREYHDFSIFPITPGENTGNIIFTYEDSTGKEIEIKRPIFFNAVEMSFPDGGEVYPPWGPEIDENAKGIKKWYYIGGGVGGIILVTFLMLRRRKAKKRDFEDYE